MRFPPYLGGLEPPTFGSGGQRSIQLSHRYIALSIIINLMRFVKSKIKSIIGALVQVGSVRQYVNIFKVFLIDLLNHGVNR